MRKNILGLASLLAATSAIASAGNNVEVLTREDIGGGFYPEPGRAFRSHSTQGERGYPGSKLAKKARKGTLTHNALR